MTYPDISYDYYAEYCLKIAEQTENREFRLVLREMSAEWLKLSSGNGAHHHLQGGPAPQHHVHAQEGHAPKRDRPN